MRAFAIVTAVLLASALADPSAAVGPSSAGVTGAIAPAPGSQIGQPAAFRLAPLPSHLAVSRAVASARSFVPASAPAPSAFLQEQARNQGGMPFMIGGGVLFVAGAIVGGDAGTLLMVGGAGAGAYGAYVYFGG